MAEGKKAPGATGAAAEKTARGDAEPTNGTAGRASETKFTKEQLLKAERFAAQRDLVDALLDARGLYSLEDVEKRIENYRKGRVR